MENLQYSINPSIKAAAFSQIFQMVFLSGIFYAGIMINFSILDFQVVLWQNLLAIAFLALLSAIQIFSAISKTRNYHYDFYPGRIEYCGKRIVSLPYSEIQSSKINRSFFDLISGTGTISLTGKFKIKNVKNYQGK